MILHKSPFCASVHPDIAPQTAPLCERVSARAGAVDEVVVDVVFYVAEDLIIELLRILQHLQNPQETFTDHGLIGKDGELPSKAPAAALTFDWRHQG